MKHRELARQATEWCVNNAEGAPTAWEWEDKFAELILQECFMIAVNAESHNVANMIRIRFGLDRNLQLDNHKET